MKKMISCVLLLTFLLLAMSAGAGEIVRTQEYSREDDLLKFNNGADVLYLRDIVGSNSEDSTVILTRLSQTYDDENSDLPVSYILSKGHKLNLYFTERISVKGFDFYGYKTADVRYEILVLEIKKDGAVIKMTRTAPDFDDDMDKTYHAEKTRPPPASGSTS